jgi:hypothetical protein
MQLLDAPSREVCTIRRPRTNTPGAALLLMNDTQFVEAARMFATRILLEGGESDDNRFDFAYECVLGRTPAQREISVLKRLIVDYRKAYGESEQLAKDLLLIGDHKGEQDLDPCELAAWTMLASTVLNLDEAISQH